MDSTKGDLCFAGSGSFLSYVVSPHIHIMSSLFALSTHAPPSPPPGPVFLSKSKKNREESAEFHPFFLIFFRETNYGKACPGFPENIECCVNSDDAPPSELEQLIRMMNSSPIKDKDGSQNADLWPLSNDAVSWLDTNPQDIYLV